MTKPSKEARLPDGFVTPKTTDQAYSFGLKGGCAGEPCLRFAALLSNELEPHPYPRSLYRAYQHGWRKGRDLRRVALANVHGDSRPDELAEATSPIKEQETSFA